MQSLPEQLIGIFFRHHLLFLFHTGDRRHPLQVAIDADREPHEPFIEDQLFAVKPVSGLSDGGP